MLDSCTRIKQIRLYHAVMNALQRKIFLLDFILYFFGDKFIKTRGKDLYERRNNEDKDKRMLGIPFHNHDMKEKKQNLIREKNISKRIFGYISLHEVLVLKGPPWRASSALWCSMAVGRSMSNVCSGHHAQTGREYHDSPHTERTMGRVGTPPWRCYVALKVTNDRVNSPSLLVIARRTCVT